MKNFAMFVNTIFLAFILFAIVDEWPMRDNEIWVLLIPLVPLISIVALYKTANNSGNGFISLYFKRRALEEKLKIKKLEENKE